MKLFMLLAICTNFDVLSNEKSVHSFAHLLHSAPHYMVILIVFNSQSVNTTEMSDINLHSLFL